MIVIEGILCNLARLGQGYLEGFGNKGVQSKFLDQLASLTPFRCVGSFIGEVPENPFESFDVTWLSAVEGCTSSLSVGLEPGESAYIFCHIVLEV